MKKSEKILICSVAIAALYGVIDYSIKSLSSDIQESTETTTDNVQLAEISNKLQLTTKNDTMIIAPLTRSILKPWLKDAFLHIDQSTVPLIIPESSEEDDELAIQLNEQAQKLNYSGFLTMADTTIAIIDGLDYREKESVNGFVIADITKDTIQLEKNGMSFTIMAKSELNTGRFSNTPPDSNTITLDK